MGVVVVSQKYAKHRFCLAPLNTDRIRVSRLKTNGEAVFSSLSACRVDDL